MKIAWFSYYPIEWSPDAPADVRGMPKLHPATWQRVLIECIKPLEDVEIHIIVLRKDLPRTIEFTSGNVTYHLIKTIGGLRAPSLFWYDTFLVRRRLRMIKPDILHAWGTENGAAAVANRLKTPCLITIQGLATWMAELMTIPAYERFAAFLERRTIPKARMVSAESRFSVRFVRERFPGPEVRHIDLVPDPIFRSVERRPKPKVTRFLFNGLLGPRKGGDILLQALNQLDPNVNWELLVIGGTDPELIRRMRSTTSPQIWSRISFRTNLMPGEVAEELGKATIFVCPTRADTGPMAVKEAALAGVPIVASNIGGVPDYVFPCGNGFLFESGSVEGLVHSLNMSLQHPLFGKGEVNPASLAEIRNKLSVEKMTKSFFQAYNALLPASNTDGNYVDDVV